MQVAANRMTREDVMAQANTRNDEEPDAASRKVEIRPEGSAMLDATDESILDALEEDGRATLAQLSRLSGLSVSAVQSRVQKLEKRGVIKGYRAVLDYELRGLPISAFVSVTPLDYSQEADIPGKLHELEGVVSCYSIAGAPSFMLVVRVSSPSKLEELLNRIHRTVPVSTMPGFRSLSSSTSVRRIGAGRSLRGSRPGLTSSLTISCSVGTPTPHSAAAFSAP